MFISPSSWEDREQVENRSEKTVLAHLYCEGFLGNACAKKRLFYFVFSCFIM